MVTGRGGDDAVTPPEIRYARNGDVELAYETFGDVETGEPLLLIMGLDFQMVWWPDDFCRLLAKNGFAVVRYDNRDTGLSTHFASPGRPDPWKALLGRTTPIYTGRDMLDDALAVMAAAGWTSAHVMGASMGAAQAQALALLHPDRVRSLTSVMGLPAGVGPLKNLTYLRFGVFRQLRKLRPGTTHEERVEFLVGVARAMAGPGYPFPEEWARAAAGISDDRCPRDQRTTQRHLAEHDHRAHARHHRRRRPHHQPARRPRHGTRDPGIDAGHAPRHGPRPAARAVAGDRRPRPDDHRQPRRRTLTARGRRYDGDRVPWWKRSVQSPSAPRTQIELRREPSGPVIR
jgi:pimeloyl-ACP methyl ester carboxylesterase